MEKIDYFDLVRKAWEITRQNRYLWWLGLIVGLDSGINLDFPGKQENFLPSPAAMEKINHWLIDRFPLVIFLSFSLLMILFIWTLVRIWVFGGMISSIQSADQGIRLRFKESLVKGKDSFRRIFWIKLLATLAALSSLLFILTPILSLFSLGAWGMGIFSSLFGGTLLLLLLVLISFTERFGIFYAILSRLDVRDAISAGYRLFLKNIGPSLLMYLCLMPIFILLGLVSFPLLSLLVFLPLTLAVLLPFGKIITLAILASGGVIFLLFSLLISSIATVFLNSAWYLFFKKIASPKEESTVLDPESVPGEISLPERA